MGRLCFPGATQIVDFYHALEHAGKVVVALLGSKEHPEYKPRRRRWAKRLLNDKVEQLIAGSPGMRRQSPSPGRGRGTGLLRQQRRPDAIWHFPAEGFFIGSGVIEAGCKTVIGARCKQSGMFWGRPGAENVLALRCIHCSRRLGTFWKDRLNSHAARTTPWRWRPSEEFRRAPPPV